MKKAFKMIPLKGMLAQGLLQQIRILLSSPAHGGGSVLPRFGLYGKGIGQGKGVALAGAEGEKGE